MIENEKLKELYSNLYPNLTKEINKLNKKLEKESKKKERATNPLLLKVDEKYLNADLKIMFFGQGTNRWLGERNNGVFHENFEPILDLYEHFYLGDACFSYGGQFWNGINRFKKLVEKKFPHNNIGYIWNNIIKIGKCEKGFSNSINNITNKYFNVILKEIEILQPDVLIFFTGPNYDIHLEIILKELKKKEIKPFKEKELCKIISDKINLTFRTYHPNYLWRHNINKFFNTIVAEISKEIPTLTLEKRKRTDYITDIEIKYFKIFEDIKITFSENINILLGNNGLGKTSILQAVTFGVLPIEYIKNFNNSAYINFKEEEAEIKTYWDANETRKLYIYPSGVKEEESEVYLKQEQFIIFSYGVNLNTNIDQQHATVIEELIDGETEPIFTDSIFENNYDKMHDPLLILEKLDDKIKITPNIDKEKIRKNVLKIYSNENLDGKIRKIIKQEIDSITKKIIQLNNLILTTINNFLKLVKETERIQIYYNEKEKIYYFKDFNKNNIRTEELSEGYRDHILLITDIIVRILSARNLILSEEKNKINKDIFTQAKGVIIMDEFDRHLHPTWQKKLISQLKKTFSNIQFILTTHNPVSLLNRDENEIQKLEVDKRTGNIIAIPFNESTKLSDVELILLKFFGLNSIVGNELQNKIDEYYKIKLAGKQAPVLEKELQNLFVGVPIPDIRYLKFLEQLQKTNIDIKNLDEIRELDFESPEQEEEWNKFFENINQ